MNTTIFQRIGMTLTGIFFIVMPDLSHAQRILTLEEATNIALKNSPEIIKSELNMTISKENLNAREAATKSRFELRINPFYYSQSRTFDRNYSRWIGGEEIGSTGDFIVSQPIKPTDGRLTLQNTFTYYDNYSEFSGLESTSKGFSNYLFLSYTQPVFTYNKLKMELNQLRLSLENATLSYAIQRLYLERAVNQYFYNVYQRKMSLIVAQDELKNQEISYQIIKSKVEGGLSAREELLQAELNLATSKSNLQNAQVNFDNAKDDFRQYIGMPLSEEFDIEANVEFAEVMVDLDKAILNGLETRMELRQREINIKNSQDQLTVAKSTNEFAGSVDLSVGIKGDSPNFTEIYEKPTRSPRVGIQFNIPIWDWGERKSNIKAAEAAIRIEEINLDAEKTNVELGIRQSYRSLQNLGMQIEIARQNEKNAQLTYEINLERYKNGDLTSMDLGRYQNQLSEKKMNLANSLISYKLELLNMKIQSLWDFENNISFVPKEFQENISKD
jgi:outer membrane protein TolC